MLLRVAPSTSTDTATAPPALFSLCSFTDALAYLHYYTPNRLPRGRYLAPNHLRLLAAWLGRPDPGLRSIRAHPLLAAHLSLLHAADLLPPVGSRLAPTPTAHAWLHAPPPEQRQQLLAVASDAARWEQQLAQVGWQAVVGPDWQALVRQQLSIPDEDGPPAKARWLQPAADGAWRLRLPPSLPAWLRFDLHQLGQWMPPDIVHCSDLSLARAMHNGYSERLIHWLLETATGQPLSPERAAQLARWRHRAHAHLVQPGLLLTTSHPAYLLAIFKQARFRPLIDRQLSPRHALVNPALIPQLQPWLQKRGYALHLPTAAELPSGETAGDSAFSWLGLRVLQGLADIVPFAPLPSAGQLADAAASAAGQLTPLRQAEIERQAQAVLAGLREAIRGRDAFFPPSAPPSPQTLDMVRLAIRQQALLHAAYQSLGDPQPRFRRLLPLRLEQRGDLYYLHAYCYQAEAELVYRLDRFQEIDLAPATQ